MIHRPIVSTKRSRVVHAGIVVTSLLGLAMQTSRVSADDSGDLQSKIASDLLPDTVVAYAEVPRLGELIQLVVDHPLRQQIQSMPAVEAIRDLPDLRPVRDGVAAFEANMGQSWDDSLATLTDGGVHFAFDLSTRGGAILVRSSSQDQLERFQRFILAASQLTGGKLHIAKQAEYRGFKAFALRNEARMALMDEWLIITNNPALGKSIIDRYLDGSDDSLNKSEQFRAALNSIGDASVKSYVDLNAIRELGVAPKLYGGKTENIAAEVLFGGIVSNLQHTPYATGMINLESSGISLALSTPHEKQWSEGREYYFGETGDGAAPAKLQVPDQVFALSTYRDLSQMWLRAPDLMNDKANDDLAKADTNLTTFFSGRDFGEDILGSLLPGIQLVVAKQTFSEAAPIPAIKLPAFALQFRMRHPEETTPEFRRVFQSFVGFINVVGAMQGQPQLDQDMEKTDKLTLVSASYVSPRDPQDESTVAINYNFSPSLAFSGDRMVIASTKGLAHSIATHDHSEPESQQNSNTHARLNVDPLAEILNDNRSQLVAQNMLEKGHSPDQADAEIDVLFDILNLFQNVGLDVRTGDGKLELSARVTVQKD